MKAHCYSYCLIVPVRTSIRRGPSGLVQATLGGDFFSTPHIQLTPVSSNNSIFALLFLAPQIR